MGGTWVHWQMFAPSFSFLSSADTDPSPVNRGFVWREIVRYGLDKRLKVCCSPP
jgi:hypothetical protein